MLFIRVDPALECNRAEILGVGAVKIQVNFSRKYCFDVFGAEMVGVGSGIINVSFQGSTAVECAKHKLSLLSVFLEIMLLSLWGKSCWCWFCV